MSISRYSLSSADSNAIDWDKEIKDLSPQTHWNFSDHLNAKYLKKSDSHPTNVVATARVVSAVLSFHLKDEDKAEPFGPMAEMYGRRTAIPSDLESDDLNLLSEIVKLATNPEFVARIQDVLWVRTGKLSYAEKGVEAYIRSANVLFSEVDWPYYFERINRALNIAEAMGSAGKACTERLVSEIVSKLEMMKGDDPSFLTYKLVLELANRKIGPSRSELLKFARQGLMSKANESNPHRGSDYEQLCSYLGR